MEPEQRESQVTGRMVYQNVSASAFFAERITINSFEPNGAAALLEGLFKNLKPDPNTATAAVAAAATMEAEPPNAAVDTPQPQGGQSNGMSGQQNGPSNNLRTAQTRNGAAFQSLPSVSRTKIGRGKAGSVGGNRGGKN